MGRSPMSYPLSFLSRLLLFAAVSLAACGTLSQPVPRSSALELSEANLYDLLLGEIALQRGEARLAAQTYVDVAKRTRDPRVARRAIEVANFARMPELAVEAAKTWLSVEPTSPPALQVLAALLIGAKRVEEAEPYLEKLLAADGVNVENGFMQLNRLLAGTPDKAVNLRVVRKLAERHPQLPQARVAIAQAALAPGDHAPPLPAIPPSPARPPRWLIPHIS